MYTQINACVERERERDHIKMRAKTDQGNMRNREYSPAMNKSENDVIVWPIAAKYTFFHSIFILNLIFLKIKRLSQNSVIKLWWNEILKTMIEGGGGVDNNDKLYILKKCITHDGKCQEWKKKDIKALMGVTSHQNEYEISKK